ncbi:MAG TPA: sulfite exporter TauE/SafE family protein, partial [Rectinemataceae bacterium]|nr:sulfite exporter TauE/SafE family protein [Rectinemataceae bacterium]
MVTSSFLVLLGTGLIAGILSGFFGIGGGVIIVPALIYLLGFSQHKATGTSLAVLLPPIGLGAVLEYYRNDSVDLHAAIVIAIASLVGAWLGAVAANKLPGPVLRLLFGIFIVLMGLYLIWGAIKRLGW